MWLIQTSAVPQDADSAAWAAVLGQAITRSHWAVRFWIIDSVNDLLPLWKIHYVVFFKVATLVLLKPYINNFLHKDGKAIVTSKAFFTSFDFKFQYLIINTV